MRSFYITFVSDDVEKMRIFGALLDAGMQNFVITEDISTVAENVQPVVHAHWILLSGGVARCSNCNRCVGSWDYDNADNYCRVCGAKMDEEPETDKK